MNSSSTDADRRRKFDRLVAVFHPDMYRYAAWLCRDKAIAEDVVQEALLRAWKSLDALRDDAAVQMRLLALDYLAPRSADHQSIRTVIEENRRPGDEALMIRLAEYERNL